MGISNPLMQVNAPKPRDYRRVKSIAKSLFGNQSNQEEETDPLVQRQPIQEPTTSEYTVDEESIPGVLNLSQAVSEHRKSTPRPTKSNLLFERKNTEVQEPEVDQTKVERMKKLAKANMIGKGVSAIFQTYLNAKDIDTPMINDSIAPFAINRLQGVEDQYLKDLSDMRNRALNNEDYNLEMANREALINEQNRVSQTSATQRYEQELNLLDKRSDDQIMSDAVSAGVYEQGMNVEQAKSAIAKKNAERAAIDDAHKKSNTYRNYQYGRKDDEDKNWTENEQLVRQYAYSKIKEIDDKISSLDTNSLTYEDDVKKLESQKKDQQSILDHKPGSKQLDIYSQDANQWKRAKDEEQINTWTQEAANYVFDNLKNTGDFGQAKSALAQMYTKLGYDDPEGMADNDLYRYRESNPSDQIGADISKFREIGREKMINPEDRAVNNINQTQQELNSQIESLASKYGLNGQDLEGLNSILENKANRGDKEAEKDRFNFQYLLGLLNNQQNTLQHVQKSLQDELVFKP